MKRKLSSNSFGENAFDVFNYILLTVFTICALYPLIYVLFASLSDPTLFMQHSGILWKPLKFSLNAYRLVFDNPMITKGYLNTFIIVVSGLVLNIFLTCFGAYALSRKGLRYRKQLMLFIVFTMFFNGGLIPLYFTVKGLGLTNTLASLIIPQAISAFNLIIMKTAFDAVPDSLEESAKIDGANEFVILFRIMIPLCMPVMAVMLLYYGVSHWNSWFNAMIFLQDRSLYPLQLVLRELLLLNDASSMATGASGGEVAIIGETLKHATIIVATVPILLVYPFLQKYFVKGALIGAIKG
ncbi:carbohydrate ABC transporter permease [Paenibacillus macquariensis]|uniref:Aldouronate transport system permease protein n=1 Tax=Paenibacillus macquariensis TaxID=948756 RepID=A0ABY1JJB1_9BACL|nr:carbohydrate ABC transporter permease [Paenibacillus macquariensis]MEC0089681.1 carbohydrate ABC transporter permease [Paenibacillus macquariensis]OAB30838.1 sugar ABC transporter permease [Paenibacillus macquariensis subsp. macquariensis]SIQ28664.1 putative aldouronate transport system permease protein [Paenibacillus macquariensis]